MASRTQEILFALFGLNRAGRILYTTLFVLAVPALMVWTLVLPRAHFSEEDERLFRAARHGDVAALTQSLDEGAGVNDAAPVDGKTALFRAAVFGHTDAVRLLISRGADPAKRGNDGRTALEVVTAAIADEKDPSASKALASVASLLKAMEPKR
jgi:hypothetical protein